MMYKALIIGCGNIGAMYDFDSKSVATYAKAFHLDSEIDFEVYDADRGVSRKVAERYGVCCVNELNPEMYRNYDIVVISTPTASHYEYIYPLLEHGPRLVICEKPVDNDRTRLDCLLRLYHKSKTKVIVNYFRRFQPDIIRLRHEIASIQRNESCTNILVTYQRGFHNNASHAVDLIEFLLNKKIDFSAAIVTNSMSDEFENDPTLCVSLLSEGMNVHIIGLAHVKFSYFDISLFFPNNAVLLKNCGDEIEILSKTDKTGNFYPKLYRRDYRNEVLGSHMVNVVSYAKRILKEKELSDNFETSVSVSDRMLELMQR